jgi:hypothetical protein
MATQVATKVVSPGSAFPELLRRSRFASFDPIIHQTYGTPPSHLHRGNWGLKRPIAQRKRNAFISLKNFEEHEHYIEWSNAESQVRLIDRIEELNVAPRLVPQVPWFVGLGPAASTPWSMMDSEFSPGDTGMSTLPELVPAFTPDLKGLGLRGKGVYGKRQSDDGYLHPNLHAMSPRVFNRYLKKLRSLRPEFQKFLKKNGVTTSIRESGVPPGNLHIRFLGQHFDKQFRKDTQDKSVVHPNQAQPIRQQPHRLGGLTYASPTYLESFFTSGAQPGIVLEAVSNSSYSHSEDTRSYLVSTAGFVGKLDAKRAGANIQPAFNHRGIAYLPSALLAGRTTGNTFIKVRVTDLHLERLPTTVTAFPSLNSSKDVNIRMDLTIHPSPDDHSRTNTHTPGSMHYNAPEDSGHPQRSSSRFARNFGGLKKYSMPNKNSDKTTTTATTTTKPGRSATALAMLTNLNKNAKVRESAPHFGMNWSRPRPNRDWQDDDWIDSETK